MNALRNVVSASSFATGLLERCTFPTSGTLHCAVSGGADSLALLLLASRTQQPVVAWHVDHGIRRNSADEFALVRQVAEALGAEAELRNVRVEPGPNLEARAQIGRAHV